jgi:hypothetical protein
MSLDKGSLDESDFDTTELVVEEVLEKYFLKETLMFLR